MGSVERHFFGQDDPRRYGARTSNPWSTRVLGVRLLLLGAFFSFIFYGRGRWVPTVGMASALRSVYRRLPRKGKPMISLKSFQNAWIQVRLLAASVVTLWGAQWGGRRKAHTTPHLLSSLDSQPGSTQVFSALSPHTSPMYSPLTVHKQPIVKSRRTRGPRAIWSWRGLRARHTRELVTCARWC